MGSAAIGQMSHYSLARGYAANATISRTLGLPHRNLTGQQLTLMQRASVEARTAAIYYPAVKLSAVINDGYGSLSQRAKYAAASAALMACSDASASSFTESVIDHPYLAVAGAAAISALAIGTPIAKYVRLSRNNAKLTNMVDSLQTTNRNLTGLRDTYLTGILSMTEGDRARFLGLISSQVIFTETPDNFAKLIAPFPEEAGRMFLRLMQGDARTFEAVEKAISAMPMADRAKVGKVIYVDSQGDEKALSNVFPKGLPIKEMLEAFDEVARQSENDTTKRNTLLENASHSAQMPIVLNVIKLAGRPHAKILSRLMAHEDQQVSLAAFNRLVEICKDNETEKSKVLAAAAKSKHAAVKLAALEMIPDSSKALLRTFLEGTDPAVMMKLFEKAPDILSAGNLNALLNYGPAPMLKIAAHPSATPDIFAGAIAETAEKVVDKAEEGHNETYSEQVEDGWSSSSGTTYRTETKSRWVVDNPEIFHRSIPEKLLGEVADILADRGREFSERAMELLDAILRKRSSSGYSGNPTRNLQLACKSEWLFREVAKSRESGGTLTATSIQKIVQRLASADPADAAESLSQIDVSLAGRMLANLELDARARIVECLPAGFMARIVGSMQK